MWSLLLPIFLGAASVSAVPELKLVHVVFSHKFLAPVNTTGQNGPIFPEKLDHEHFLQETDDMDNKAKMDMFNLGVFIRRRYDSFLGQIYHPDFTEMRTTQYVLSMISGMLVDAGLWPPAGPQKWNPELNWQPVPIEYQPVKKDTLLLGYLCPNFQEELSRGNHSAILAEHSQLLDYISKNSGRKVETLWDVALVYTWLETIVSQNIFLPVWATKLYPNEEMKNLSLLAYEAFSETTLQKSLNGGSMLKKIILDTMMHQTSKAANKTKLLMYSGEETNVMGLLQILGTEAHILGQGASVIFEVYSDSISHEYTIKMLYLTDVGAYKLIPLKLDNCEEYCPLIKFPTIVDTVLPIDELSACHQKRNTPSQNGRSNNSSAILSHMISVPTILIALLLSKFP